MASVLLLAVSCNAQPTPLVPPPVTNQQSHATTTPPTDQTQQPQKPSASANIMDAISFTPNNSLFRITKSKIAISQILDPKESVSKSLECGTNHPLSYYHGLLDKFSKTDVGVKYAFSYIASKQNQEPYPVEIFVLPNKLGYSTLKQFKSDYDTCAAGGVYPQLVNNNFLLFESSCSTGVDDGSGRPHGCSEVQDFIDPTLKLK